MTEIHGLLIGIDDYSTYDESTGQPAGTSDLAGGLNDVHGWWTLARSMGASPENLRVLTAPALSPEQRDALGRGAGDAQYRTATRDEVLEGVKWLVHSLKGRPEARGLITYSGHGDVEAGELVLCPSNVQGDPLEHALSFAELDELLHHLDVPGQVTLLLDTCHAGAGDRVHGERRLRGGGRLESATRLQSPQVVLAACRTQETSAELQLVTGARGAFSWAVGSLLQRWASPDGEDFVFPIDNLELTRRAARLLDGMALHQTPELEGPLELASQAVFVGGEVPSSTPPSTKDRELSPGLSGYYRIYYVHDDNGARVAEILATGDSYRAGDGYAANMEYWHVESGAGFWSAQSIDLDTHHTADSSSSKPSDHGFAWPPSQCYALSATSFESVSTLSGTQKSGLWDLPISTCFFRETGSAAFLITRDGFGTPSAIVWMRSNDEQVFSSGTSDTKFYRITNQLDWVTGNVPAS
ncbi:MAG: hypothetical protein AAF533_29080 [Acidobacteriota bacterium]